MNDFLEKFSDSEIRIAGEVLSNWFPYLTRGLCKSCIVTLNETVRSIHTEENFSIATARNIVVEQPIDDDEVNCRIHSSHQMNEHVEPSSNAMFRSLAARVNRTGKRYRADITMEKELSEEEDTETISRSYNVIASSSDRMKEHVDPSSNSMFVDRTGKRYRADIALEKELSDEEDSETISRSYNINASSTAVLRTPEVGEVKLKASLSRDHRESLRLSLVERKTDFIYMDRVNGRVVNILEGLELHKGIFSAKEQMRIVNFVEELREMGRNGRLKDRTYSAPVKWMRGKGRVTLQFGCCYNYATDRQGNPPGILKSEMVDPLPDLFKVMIRRLVRWHVLEPSSVPDSCIVNIYEEGDCIPPHIDSHDFVRPFCTVSLLSECEILFGANLKIVGPGEFAGSYTLPLPIGSVLVINGNGADVAKHCIPAVPAKRISITFRKMDTPKRPYGYAPEPDLEGLQPLTDKEDRSNEYTSDNSGSTTYEIDDLNSYHHSKHGSSPISDRVDRRRDIIAENSYPRRRIL